MKYKLLALLVTLAIPAVGAPDVKISSCDPSLVVRDGRDIEGQSIAGEMVDLLIPCVSKDDLEKILADLAPKAGVNGNVLIQAVHKAKDVSVGLTTKVITR